jgi:DNA topoisomerase I
MSTLVIVESPAKCKKIEEFLGLGVTCLATYGHLRKIECLDDTDKANDFSRIKYSPIDPTKQRHMAKLKREIAGSSEVILATDNDREGEAIAWHICDIANLSVSTTKRVVFGEISKKAIQHAFAHPTVLNMSVVYAQQAREVMDMMIGFMASPTLWKALGTTPSKTTTTALGRCQTPSLRLIYDRHQKFSDSTPDMEYKTTGYFTSQHMPFELTHAFHSETDAHDFLSAHGDKPFIYSVSEPSRGFTKAPSPLNTSLLQQVASNELNMSPQETMKCAQHLYEGGYITYMRTESKTHGCEFIETVSKYIAGLFGDERAPQYMSGAQITPDLEAGSTSALPHEPIHPVNIQINHSAVTGVGPREIQLYKLIWKQSIQSCMAAAQFQYITACLTSQGLSQSYIFKCRAQQSIFPGWMAIGEKKTDSSELKTYELLRNIAPGKEFLATRIVSAFVVKTGETHYSEARLIQTIDKMGIGRPSTFSMLVDKIQEYKYVTKKTIRGQDVVANDIIFECGKGVRCVEEHRQFGSEKNKLFIEPLGIKVAEFAMNYYASIFDYDYVKHMEDTLGAIKCNDDRVAACKECHTHLRDLADQCTKHVRAAIASQKINIVLDSSHTLILGKYGLVVKKMSHGSNRATFVPVKDGLTQSTLDMNHPYTLDEVVDLDKIARSTSEKPPGYLGRYKHCDLYIKNGRYGMYAQWGENTQNLSRDLSDQDLSTVTYADVYKILEQDGVLNPKVPINMVRALSKTTSIRSGKYGDYIYHKPLRAKNPSFYKLADFKQNYRTCEKDEIIKWIKDTHGIK